MSLSYTSSVIQPSCSPSLPRWTSPAPPDVTTRIAATAVVSPAPLGPETSLSRAQGTPRVPGAPGAPGARKSSEASMLLTSNQNHEHHEIWKISLNKNSKNCHMFFGDLEPALSFTSIIGNSSRMLRLAQWGTWWLQKGGKPMPKPWVRGVKGSICIDISGWQPWRVKLCNSCYSRKSNNS